MRGTARIYYMELRNWMKRQYRGRLERSVRGKSSTENEEVIKMEEEKHGDTDPGREPEPKSEALPVTEDKVEQLEEKTTKFEPVKETGKAEHSENDENCTTGKNKIISRSATALDEEGDSSDDSYMTADEEGSEDLNVENPVEDTVAATGSEDSPPHTVTSELTLLLLGDTNSIEIGPKNILVDHEEQTNVEKFSSRLYDLCGRHICVINMLGQQNTDRFSSNRGIHAFLLLLPNGSHNSHYSSGVQWLEKALGKRSLAYLMTVLTHSSDEECESALTDLKSNSTFSEERYHRCKRNMMDGNEIVALMEKIDLMVSKNDPHCYMWDDNQKTEERLPDHKTKEEETVAEAIDHHTVDEVTGCASKINPAFDPVNAHAEENQERGEQDAQYVKSSEPQKKDTAMDGNKDESVTTSQDVNLMKEYQRETKALLTKLRLQDKKWTPADYLSINPVKQHHDTSEKDLANTFLQKLMMLDYRARYIPVSQDGPDVSYSKPSQNEIIDDDFDALFTFNVDSGQSKHSHVHPMDVQMAVFHCSDSFLKQSIITKLSQCQYALPLLVPHPVTMDIECPLWTLRQIRKSWKIKNNSHTVTMKSMPIYTAETPMVSFVRLGSLSLSKSQLMNTLINDRHNTFFHRNCPGSTKSRCLLDGVVEIGWYCPAGKDNDAFTDCTAFCNLHGDALTLDKQRDILIEKSSVIVVLLPTLEKGDQSWTVISDLLKSPKPLICLIVDNDCGPSKMKDGKYKMGLKDKSQSDVSDQLKGIIRKILSGPCDSFQLETIAQMSQIKVDEDDTACQSGKSAAERIVELLKGMEVSDIKDKHLPCQGKLWHEWGRINKAQYHLKGRIEEEKCQRQNELEGLRRQQCAASCSELMQRFIGSLSSLPPEEKEYFLKWTQILLDALSTDDLSSILHNYDQKWSEVLDLKKKHDKSDQLQHKQTELEKLSAKLQSATFGIEHIFREMGQIYEAHKSLKKPTRNETTDWSKYPELAAELMISGHPMELMDGDAGHVPLTWISSLLDEVIKKLGDQRVFVLSVMGVQSSGKSTMLNAMFGLQFAVSAGRCTKGAFMQLIRVTEETKKDLNLKCDYVLVVDTEGLRALELAGNTTLHHDNELATFVVGLGNMTLFNIFGENPADMQDVVQIVVQAFMRMKKVKLSPSCLFVHQNVTDIAAAERNMDGKRRLQEKLDQMTKLAAKEEVCDAECFSEVIPFDVQKDVKYFAQLWEGSPPMAPPNPGYSESIQELKNIILSKASQSDGITLSQFNSKVRDLWNALLKENFVFSFKNTLEIAAYRQLEVQYGNWTWTLRSNMLTVEDKLYTRIENNTLDKVELRVLHHEMSKTYEEIKKDMTKYFDDERDKETLVQWRGRFESKIKEFYDEQVSGVKRKLDEVIEQRNAGKKVDERKTEFENLLLQKSKELAHQLKDKVNDEEELKKQFTHVWSQWVSELTQDVKPIKTINLEDDQFSILRDIGFETFLIQESKDSGYYPKIFVMGDYSKYVTFNRENEASFGGKVKAIFKSLVMSNKEKKLPHEAQNLIWSLIDGVTAQSLDIIKSKPVSTRGYSQTYLQEVANHVTTSVAEFVSRTNFALKKEFTVDILLYVFDRVGALLSESHEKYKRSNDAVTFVESKKMDYYKIFISFCKGSSSAVVLAEIICDKLKCSSVEAVCNKTAKDLAGELRCGFPAFNGNRLTLEKHMLKTLAEEENFDCFITYIRHPRKQMENFIKKKVSEYIYEDHREKAEIILERNVYHIHQLVRQALFTATDKVKAKREETKKDETQRVESPLIAMWLREFLDLLKDKLKFDTISSENFSDINNFDTLKDELEKGFESLFTDMTNFPLERMKESRQKPDQILINQLCKCCWEQCPFCGAVCTNTVENHSPDDHSVPFHRPSGVKGWHYRDTVEMDIDFCTTNVASEGSFYPHWDSDSTIPYKQYRTAGPKYEYWRIDADDSKLIYWKWFVCRFQKQVEDHYNLKFQGLGKIPLEWRRHTKEEAIESLDEMCDRTNTNLTANDHDSALSI